MLLDIHCHIWKNQSRPAALSQCFWLKDKCAPTIRHKGESFVFKQTWSGSLGFCSNSARDHTNNSYYCARCCITCYPDLLYLCMNMNVWGALAHVQIQLHISKFYFVGRLNRSRRSFQSQSVRAKLHAHTHCHACMHCVHFSQGCHGNSYSMKCQCIQANWHTYTHTHAVNTRSSMKSCRAAFRTY